MKKLTLLLLLQGLSGFSQNKLIGIWNYIDEESSYKIYKDNNLYSISDYKYGEALSEIDLSKSKYGFGRFFSFFKNYPSIDSLSLSDSIHDYFYEYNLEYDDELEDPPASIDDYKYENGDTLMTILYTASKGSQLYVFYKKVNILPRYFEDYLKDKEPAVYADYLKVAWNRGEIKVKKSIIHTDKKVATKAYLLKDDVIEILERQEKWLRIRYTSKKNKITTGWIKKSDVK